MAKDDKKKPELKVSPGEKDKKGDEKARAKQLLSKHPEIMYNARNLFRNENGTTIVEESVPRGDPKKEDVIMPRTQGDLTDTDLREMAVFASSLVDDTLRQYDQKVAYEDALQRAIGSKDGGKYAGKVNASTFSLIMDTMGKKAKKASEESSEPIQEITKEARMDKGMILAELEATRIKMAALEALAGDEGMDKEAKEKPTCKKCGEKHWPFMGCGKKEKSEDKEDKKDDKSEKGADKDDKKGADKEAKEMPTCAKCSKKHWPFQGCGKKEDKKDDKKEKTAMENIVESLDEIAGTLEAQKDYELFKIAYQIDQVSDVLMGKKEAATLESDTDEKYMKEFFKAGMREGDSDEKSYMAAFNTDTTTELKDKYPKGLGKDASAMPYQVKK
jgi:hypothetical protein